MTEYLLLKWGTLKGWNFETDETRSAAKKYFDSGVHSMSVACQHDTPEMKEALCGLIDAVQGDIRNDWTGETMSKDKAKQYVMGYRA